MRPIHFILFVFTGCGVFDLGVSELYLSLTFDYQPIRMVDSSIVILKWDELSREGFKHYKIEKRRFVYAKWELVGIVTNRLATTYDDVIYDDEDWHYRVGLENDEGDLLWREGVAKVPKTRQLFVPEERSTITEAINDVLIDTGDTVWVGPGEYNEVLDFTGRDIVVISSEGAYKTGILGEIQNPDTRIRMNMGILDGFKISDGSTSGRAGGIDLEGSGIVRRCIITENYAGLFGGGIYMKGESELWNSVVFNNGSPRAANAMIRNIGGKIINCVFTNVNISYNSNITVELDSSELIMLNNIIYRDKGNGTNVVFSVKNDSSNVVFDYSFVNPALDYGNSSGIGTGEPGLIFFDDSTETLHFQLEPGSPCLNTGHPGSEFLNTDGSRNTMGPNGGPLGW